MKPPLNNRTVFNNHGYAYSLGKQIGKGGEGAVYEIADRPNPLTGSRLHLNNVNSG